MVSTQTPTNPLTNWSTIKLGKNPINPSANDPDALTLL